MISVSKKSHKFLTHLLDQLVANHDLSTEESGRILAVVQPAVCDWRRLARYLLWASLFSLIISLSAFLSSEFLLELLERLFSVPDSVLAALFGILAAGCYWMGASRSRRRPEYGVTNEAIMFLGVLATATSVCFLGAALDLSEEHFSTMILFTTICYGLLGVFLQSPLIWCFSLLSFGFWFGVRTGYASNGGMYWLGMSYPERFVLLGLALTGVTTCGRAWGKFRRLYPTSRNMGLLYLFVALWILALRENYESGELLARVGQLEHIGWKLLLGVASIAAIWLGCRRDESGYRGFGLTFLFINLYTIFFETFWDAMHKGLFFLLLALSLWFLGRLAERIWLKSEQLLIPSIQAD